MTLSSRHDLDKRRNWDGQMPWFPPEIGWLDQLHDFFKLFLAIYGNHIWFLFCFGQSMAISPGFCSAVPTAANLARPAPRSSRTGDWPSSRWRRTLPSQIWEKSYDTAGGVKVTSQFGEKKHSQMFHIPFFDPICIWMYLSFCSHGWHRTQCRWKKTSCLLYTMPIEDQDTLRLEHLWDQQRAIAMKGPLQKLLRRSLHLRRSFFLTEKAYGLVWSRPAACSLWKVST